ncbi:MAG: hypothetical protein AAGD07_19575, partial [Planctomycetota bacterium]
VLELRSLLESRHHFGDRLLHLLGLSNLLTLKLTVIPTEVLIFVSLRGRFLALAAGASAASFILRALVIARSPASMRSWIS